MPSSLNACGIDPASWTTAQGRTLVDFLLSQQESDGSLDYTPGDGSESLYSSQDAVRALAGDVFTADPPARADGTSPRTLAPPVVAAGTNVPLTLVLDGGSQSSGGTSVRTCEVTALRVGLGVRNRELRLVRFRRSDLASCGSNESVNLCGVEIAVALRWTESRVAVTELGEESGARETSDIGEADRDRRARTIEVGVELLPRYAGLGTVLAPDLVALGSMDGGYPSRTDQAAERR